MIANGVLGFALGLDFLLGDPRSSWHPVRLMGNAATAFEAKARARGADLKLSGVLLALGLPALVAALASFCLTVAPEPARWVLSGIFVWVSISARDMLSHARVVLRPLDRGDLPGARVALARIVGRDVEALDETGIRRACVESVAESLCDGVLAPIFWALLFGAPAALAYRALNTLDSMVGHNNERYREFGWASAKLDDVANWVPARLSAVFVSQAAAILKLNPKRAWDCARAQGASQISPNAGWPEGAFAGALEIRLGGPSTYQGELVNKPYLEGGTAALDARRCGRALWLFALSVVLAVGLIESLIFYF